MATIATCHSNDRFIDILFRDLKLNASAQHQQLLKMSASLSLSPQNDTLCLLWLCQQGSLWGKKSRAEFHHLPDTTREPPTSQRRTCSHSGPPNTLTCGLLRSLQTRCKYRVTHVCPAARLFDYPTQILRSFCAEQHMWTFITSALIRVTPRTFWDVAAL